MRHPDKGGEIVKAGAGWLAVCPLSELPLPGSRGVLRESGEFPLRAFVVRTAVGLRAFVNRCPHAGHPLDWVPHRFLDRRGDLILCASHGARFEPRGGRCVAGPCRGKRLTPLPLKVDGDGWVWIRLPQPSSMRR